MRPDRAGRLSPSSVFCLSFAVALWARSNRSASCLFAVFFLIPGRSPFFLRFRPLRLLDDKPNTLVQHQHSRSSNSGGCFTLSNTRLSNKWSMEYLGASKPTPPAMALIACIGLPVHSEQDITSAPAVEGLARPRNSRRQSSISSIWSSHLTLLHSRRHE